MKKLLTLAICGVIAVSAAHAQFTANVDAGRLKDFDGTSMAPGSLLLLIAAGADGIFSNTLSSGQFVSGDDLLLASSSFNMFGGDQTKQPTDETLSTFNATTSPTGQLVALRWFPAITLQQFSTAVTPTAGQHFGTYNPSMYPAVNGTNLAPDGGQPWAAPATGLVQLNFFTTDSTDGGTQLPIEGFAQFTVVPEPSTWALLTVGVLGLAAMRRRLGRS